MSPEQTKWNYDINLFRAEPPEVKKQVVGLFHGRSQSLARGHGILRTHLDIKGRRFKKTEKQPWIIHSESAFLSESTSNTASRNPK